MSFVLIRRIWAVLASVLVFVVCTRAHAARPVIETGREGDVLGLFAPYTLGSEVADGWKLWNLSIQQTTIEVGLRHASGKDAGFTLVHPTQAPRNAVRTPSFAVSGDATDEHARTARDALIEAIRNNDDGEFWRVEREVLPKPGMIQRIGRARDLLDDGFVLSIAGVFLILALAIRVAWTAPPFVRIALPGIVLVGAALRYALAPASFLGAWPWSRLWPNWHSIWNSPVFAEIAALFDAEIYLSDLMLSVNFAYACVMPLVLFVHASQLLRDVKAGIVAAGLVAFSPHHIRYSHCEDAFVPSLVLTSLAFALIHTFMRDPSRTWRFVALFALPVALWQGFLLRPLNILFVGVYLAAIVLLHPDQSPPRRRITVGLVTVGVWIAAFSQFLKLHGTQVSDAIVNPGWLLRIPQSLVWPPWNLLIHPLATPPAALALSIAATVWLVKKGEKRLAIFLVGWVTAFFVAHAFVITTPMQPRYHLHLLVPFLLLASIGAVELYRRSRRLLALAGVSVALAPLIGKGWIQDVGYSDTLEYAFVRNARTLVPAGCTVLEYIGPDAKEAHESRFARIGQTLYRNTYGERFSTVVARLETSDSGKPQLNEEARAAFAKGPDACVYVYEGLLCWGRKEKSEPYAPTCQALVDAAPLETVLETWIPFRPYDPNTTPGMSDDRTHLRLALSRVVPRSNVAEARP